MSWKNVLKLGVCIFGSIVLSHFFNYGSSSLLNQSTIINILIALFTVSLAIVALMITILDKYKENVSDTANWSRHSALILKEICENTIALLLLVILLTTASFFEPVILLIPKINVLTVVLLFSITLSLFIMLDTTLSVYSLVISLTKHLSKNNFGVTDISDKEKYLIEAYRYLSEDRQKTFDEMLKAFTTNQQLDTKNK